MCCGVWTTSTGLGKCASDHLDGACWTGGLGGQAGHHMVLLSLLVVHHKDCGIIRDGGGCD